MAEHNVTKDQQFNGFRQIWTERPDGVFDGPYTVYWGSGPVICMRGRYAAGAQEGVWSYWDRTGKLDKQIRFHNDEPIETRTAPPWLDDAADQPPIDTDTLSSSATPGST
ncbi:MAG TPA: hypothetical protein VFY84_19030 [Jiangellales bacterium]|nr:hypothetical protein [Jiangellales bacterium]